LVLLMFLVAGASAFVQVPGARQTRKPDAVFATNNNDDDDNNDNDNTDFLPGVSCSGEKIAVVGSTGYIGKAVVRESLRRGYPTTAVVRPGSNADAGLFTSINSNSINSNSINNSINNIFAPAYTNSSSGIATNRKEEERESALTIRRFDVTDREACLRSMRIESQEGEEGSTSTTSSTSTSSSTSSSLLLFEPGSVDVVVCCLASRNGTPREAFAIDYQASLNVAQAAREAGARRFILLSAYCVKSAELQEPHALQFQYAKKKLEVALAKMAEESSSSSNDNNNNNAFSYVSIRPTAFFKSVSGQLETVQAGGPFILFDLGAGKTAACNPISEADLASALIDQVVDDTHANTHWNLGGPDSPGLDKLDQMKMMTKVLDLEKQPSLIYVPIGVLHFFVNSFQWLADVFRSDKLNDAAELARIVRYYAIEDMLTRSPGEKYGTMTTRQHYEYIAKNGQEYDPYTSAYGILKDRERILDESAKIVPSVEAEEKVAMEVL